MTPNTSTVLTASRDRKQSAPVPESLPAAQYVRMSDESQQYSIDNQKAAIQEYAAKYGFLIVKTYADRGRSGVVAKGREGLRELLNDVINGSADYKAILVYDVSRWGRFQDTDESAHYEFLCRSAGIPVHYCAEPFTNDGTATSTLLKALKRSMAAEFSRELSVKEFRGKSRLARLGFWVGGNPAYGYRRLLVSAEGAPKQILNWGEQKNLKTDRVILAPGPQEEIECIRSIFSMALEGESCRSIACHLNRRGITHFGRQWLHGAVYNILKNPMYAGVNVWNRTSTRMRSKRKPIARQEWIAKSGAFQPIVDRQIFDRVQVLLRIRPLLSPTTVILKRVRRLLKTKGRLSRAILQSAPGLPSLSSIRRMFGSYRRLYQKVGYQLSPFQELRSDRLNNSIRLRCELIEMIRTLFPDNVAISRFPDQRRSVLLIDGQFIVSVLFCSPIRRRGKYVWIVEPNSAESSYITLLCPVKRSHERVLGYFVFPHLDGFSTHFMFRNDPFLRAAVRFRDLSEFYATVKTVWISSYAVNAEKRLS
jgi:DNA invertase Pin-like site-specific DNA recombinase